MAILSTTMIIEQARRKSQLSVESRQAENALSMSPRSNTVVGVNYSCPQNKCLVSNSHVSKKPSSSTSDSICNDIVAMPSTNRAGLLSSHPLSPSCADNMKESDINGAHILSPNSVAFNSNNTISTCPNASDDNTNHGSRRQKRARSFSVEKTRIRYDMNLVPSAARQNEFLQRWRTSDLFSTNGREAQSNLGLAVDTFLLPVLLSSPDPAELNDQAGALNSDFAARSLKKSLYLQHSLSHISLINASSPESSSCEARTIESSLRNSAADDSTRDDVSSPIEAVTPFEDSGSVVWVPRSRSEWEDCIDEMTAVCTAAAWRRHYALNKSEPFHPPLSRDYIRDRVDIDDPLRGYQIRHKSGGWLQGFVLMTTFTTWTHYFKWDSNHVENGMFVRSDEPNPLSKHVKQFCSDSVVYKFDDGSLSSELELQPRSGDPLSGGVIWSTVAEISLVGALGCGEYLLRMALEEIARRGVYKYVVLQATDLSRKFYEKFGFVRVGAVSTYVSDPAAKAVEVNDAVGYRHWTYANESSKTLDMHGAPSYMMALSINRSTSDITDLGSTCHSDNSHPPTSFLNEMATLVVAEKPTIEPLMASRYRKRSTFEGCLSPGLNSRQHNISLRQQRRVCCEEDRGGPKDTVSYGNRKLFKTNLMRSTFGEGQGNLQSNLCIEQPQNLRPDVPHDGLLYQIPSPQRSPMSKKMSQSPQSQTSRTLLAKTHSFNPALNGSPVSPSTERWVLRKQKTEHLYRGSKNTHYYNKVVTPKEKKKYTDKTLYKSKYYFVLNFDQTTEMVRLIPLYQQGTFKGKREGRPKWKVKIAKEHHSMLDEPTQPEEETGFCRLFDIITVPSSAWDIVPSLPIAKCSSVAEESWDVLG